MSSKKHLFEGVRNILRHSKYPKRGNLREVIHHSSVFFFSFGVFADSELKTRD